MRPTRVLLCLTSLDPALGGIPAVNRSIVRALPALDRNGSPIDVRALVYHGNTPQVRSEYWQKPGCFETQGCRSSRARFLTRFLSLCLIWRPSLVLVDHLHLAVVPHLCRRLLPRGYVLFCHGTEFDGDISPRRQAAFRGARLRLSNSHFTARRLMRLFPGAAVEPCELGLDELAMPTPVDDKELLLSDAFGVPRPVTDRSVLIVGRVASGERYKGHDELIAIWSALVNRVPSAQLVIAGSGDDLDRLKALARETNAGHAVLFAGFAEPALLAGLFRRCRVFTMPSRGEGFGLVYLEAMHFGKPCVASRVDAGSEVVADGETGLLVDPANLDELREGILNLLTDDELAQRLGQAGRNRLNDRYRFRHFQQRLQRRLADVVPEFDGEESVPLADRDAREALLGTVE